MSSLRSQPRACRNKIAMHNKIPEIVSAGLPFTAGTSGAGEFASLVEFCSLRITPKNCSAHIASGLVGHYLSQTGLCTFVTLADVIVLAPGTCHTVLLKQDGSVWSTGVNPDDRSESFVPIFPQGAMTAAAGNYYTIVLTQDWNVLITGKSSNAQLSFFDGSAANRRTFSTAVKIPGAKAVAAGGYHSLVLTDEGVVWATGWNKYGQLGDGSMEDKTIFVRVMPNEAKALAAGDIHSIILKQDGSVWASGRNYNGQLGVGSRDGQVNFVNTISGGAVNVAAGGYHTMVLNEDGSVWAAGWNEYGQLGDGSKTDRIDYVRVVSSGAKAVAAGSRHSMVLKQDGSVWTTGYNLYGQLGNGSADDSEVFVQVMSTGAKVVAGGGFHSMVLKQDDTIWAAGSNKDGQLGDGTTTSEKSFVQITPLGKSTKHDCDMVHVHFMLSFTRVTAMHSIVEFGRATIASSTPKSESKTDGRY